LTDFLTDLAKDVDGKNDQEAGVTNKNTEVAVVDVAVEKIILTIEANETTLKVFKRLTNQQAWHPFSNAATSAIWYKCRRNVRPPAQNGHHCFANAWNVEVADQHRRHIDGDNSVVLTRWKSAIQLEKHYNTLQQKKWYRKASFAITNCMLL